MLPAIRLGLFTTARITRLIRSGMLEVLGQDYIRTAPPPGLAILVTVLGINLLGDGLRDTLDPRLKL